MALGYRFRHLRDGLRAWVYAREGQLAAAFVRSWSRSALRAAGALRAGTAFPAFTHELFGSLDTSHVMACFEHLVELGELLELTSHHSGVADAERVFVAAPSRLGMLSETASLWPQVDNAGRELGEQLDRDAERAAVLTAILRAGKPIDLDVLAGSVEADRPRVWELVQELIDRGLVTLSTVTVTVVSPAPNRAVGS